MATEAQIRANRRNAQKSTGPRTNRLSSPVCQRIMTSIMQNKANFRKAQMSANTFSQKDYENELRLLARKNKPNQTQFQMPTNPSKEREEKRVSGIFSVSQLPARIYYIGNPGLA